MYILVYTYIHILLYIHTLLYICIWFLYIYVYILAFTYIYIYIYTLYLLIYAYAYLYMLLYTCICTCICTWSLQCAHAGSWGGVETRRGGAIHKAAQGCLNVLTALLSSFLIGAHIEFCRDLTSVAMTVFTPRWMTRTWIEGLESCC